MRAARGEIRPAATGRSAVRSIFASISRSYQWLIAPEPPAESAPPISVAMTRAIVGEPAMNIAQTVVKSRRLWTRGLVRAT